MKDMTATNGPAMALAQATILIVDDVPDNLAVLGELLRQSGYQVKVANSGRAALRFAAQLPRPDLILLDVMMPEMDGYETMQAIRNMPQFASLPMIALTAKAMKGDREKCIEAGASDYITKPVDTEQLLSLLRVWLYR